MPPPNRVRSQDMVISVPSHTLLGDLLGPAYDPETKRHHVVLYLPDLEADMELGEFPPFIFFSPDECQARMSAPNMWILGTIL